MKLPNWLHLIWNWIVRKKFLVAAIAAVAALLAVAWGWEWLRWVWCWSWNWLGEVSEHKESRSTTLRNIGLLVGGGIAIGVAYRRSVISHRGLQNERYQKAAEMLGNRMMAVRLGGIFALHRLGKDDPEQYHVEVMRLLSSFVGYPTEETRSTEREDVRVALAVIGTRSDADIALEKKQRYRVLLSSADLSNLKLRRPNLTDARLIDANLTGTFLGRANLTNADLSGANLTETDLSKTIGLTQGQLDIACADPDKPPKLNGICDANTGVLLLWQGKPC